MKRILALILSCVMLLSVLGGCGKTETPAAEPAAEAAAEPAAEAAEEPDAAEVIPAGEGEELEVWVCQWGGWGVEGPSAFEDALKTIAANATAANLGGKGYNVKTKMISWDGFYETFLTAYSSGTGPVISSEANTAPILYHLQGGTLDLMPIYDQWVAEKNPILDQIPQEYFDFFTVDGQLIAMPFGCDVPGVIVNKELLADIGIDTVPTTWDEVLEACAALKAKYPDKMGFVHSAATPADASNFGGWFLRQHSSTYKSLDHCGNLASEESLVALNDYKQLVDNGYISEAVLTYSSDDVNRIFLNDDALFCVTGMPTWIPAEQASTEKYGFLEPLTINGKQGYCQVAVNAYYCYASEDAEKNQAALDLMKFWMENCYEHWSIGADGNIPARADYCEQLYASSPLCQAFFDATIGYGRISMDCAPFETQDETASAFDNTAVMGDVLTALLNGATAEEAAEVGNKIVNDVYAQFGY